MKAPLLVLTALIVAGTAAFITTRESSPSPGVGDVSPSGTTEAAADGPSRDLQDPLANAAGAAGQKTEAAAGDALSSPATDGTAPVTLAERQREARELELANRYGHLDGDQLRVELAVLEESVTKQRKLLFDELYSRGIYQIRHVGDPPLAAPEPGPDGRMPEQQSRTHSNPTTLATQINLATLPIDEYPDFYQLLDEAAWLREMAGQ